MFGLTLRWAKRQLNPMKTIFSLIVGLVLATGNMLAADYAKPNLATNGTNIDIPMTMQVLGLWTPEVDKLSDQGVRSFKAPVAQCLSHNFTSIEPVNQSEYGVYDEELGDYRKAERPKLEFRSGKLFAKGIPEDAYGEKEAKLFVVTPELRKAAKEAGLDLKVADITPTTLASVHIASAPVVAVTKRE